MPERPVALHEVGEFGFRHRKGLDAGGFELLDHVGLFQRAGQSGAHLHEGGTRRIRRRDVARVGALIARRSSSSRSASPARRSSATAVAWRKPTKWNIFGGYGP